MAIWLTRAGSSGEYERKFLDEGKVYLTWDDLNENLQALSTREDLLACLERTLMGSLQGIGTGRVRFGPLLRRCR